MQRYLSFFVIVLLALSSCKTVERTTHKKVEHFADTLAIQSKQDSRVGDSLSISTIQESTVTQRDTATTQITDTETEQIVEEITTTDSMGNTIRKERRTTTRNRNTSTSSASSSYQQSADRFMEQLARQLSQYEESQSGVFKSTKHNNFSEDKEKTSKPSFTASFGWSMGVSLTVVIICALVALYVRKRGLFK